MARITLTNPIKPGFMRPITIVPDEPVDVRADGTFAQGAVVTGDSSAPTIDKTSNATNITGFLLGDGSAGDKVVSIAVDGHVGPADVEIVQEVAYTVGTPDATAIAVTETGTADVPIPAAPVKTA